MKICKEHWQLMRDAVESRGMFDLVAKSGEVAVDDQVRQLEEAQRTGSVSEQTTKETFDPLMSMHWHWMNGAMSNGGLYLMTVDEQINPNNEGHYCPVCEFAKHVEDFDAKVQIESVADQQRTYCIEQNLIARPS